MAAAPSITASTIAAPPAWALLQRAIFDNTGRSVELFMQKYTERNGSPYYADDMDDLYECA